MKAHYTLRVHNAMVTDRMQGKFNQLRAGKKLGRKLRIEHAQDRNALAFHYIDSGALKKFSATHRILVGDLNTPKGRGAPRLGANPCPSILAMNRKRL
jgi:hypothetical protein